MAEKTLNTRILLKYDTLTNWTANNPILKKGEMAIATVASSTDDVLHVPTVIIKVGDGSTAYNSLPFVSAAAADVYDWAKAANKPEYTADEISGLSDYIANKVEDTNTKYQITKLSSDDNVVSFKLQSQSLGSSSWTDIDTFTWTIPTYDDSQLTSDIAAIKDGTTIDSFADVETALAEKQASGDYATKAQAQAYADAKDSAITAAQSTADANSVKITTLIGSTSGDDSKSVRTIASEEVAAIVAGADESYDTLKEIADWISNHTTDAASMNSSINTNTANITSLQSSMATAESDIDSLQSSMATAESDIDSLQSSMAAAESDIDSLQSSMAAAESDIDALQSTVSGLADIATTGNVNDLVQTSGDTLIFDCGDSAV